jgi:hypothetical protein
LALRMGGCGRGVMLSVGFVREDPEERILEQYTLGREGSSAPVVAN